MAENENGQEKTEEATPKRLEKSRSEGQIPRSKELTTAFVLIGGVAGLMFMGDALGEALKGIMRFNFTVSREAAFDTNLMLVHFTATIFAAAKALIPFFAMLALAAFLGPIALGGWLFSAKAMAPKFSRMNPISGIKRMFSVTALIEMFKAIAKFGLVAAISITMLMGYKSSLLGLAQSSLLIAIGDLTQMIGLSVLAVSCSMILIALMDVPYQIFDHSKKLKMTLQEVKDEMKDTEGKPEVKRRIRQLQMEMSQRRMMSAVPEADVVITNPEHFSVALKYDVDGGAAPIVVAKGIDFTAMKIREIANHHQVLILASPELARAIYFTTEVDKEIPSGLYLAVAQVLAFVFQLQAFEKGDGRRPKPLAKIELPDDMHYNTAGKIAAEND